MAVMRPLWIRLLLILDYLLNIIYSLVPRLKKQKGFGYVGETVSSVIGKRYYYHTDYHWFIMIHYKFLEKIDPGHCKRAIDHTRGRDQGRGK